MLSTPQLSASRAWEVLMTRQQLRTGLPILLIAVLPACSPGGGMPSTSGADPTAAGGKSDYYGTDDRQEIRDADDPRVAEWARSIAVLVVAERLTSAGHNRLTTSAPTLAEKVGLCADERFADQPAPGFCSAFLVGRDLVATAGHCLAKRGCEEIAFVFDFQEGGASADPTRIPADRVFFCHEVLARQFAQEKSGPDYALLRLDRPAIDRTPFELQIDPPAVGGRVALLGFPSGIWAKADLAGRVRRVGDNRVTTSLDSFPGHSGAVVLDLATGRAFGVHVEGSSPSFLQESECARTVGCEKVVLDGDECQGSRESPVAPFAAGIGETSPAPTDRCANRCGDPGPDPCACDQACVGNGNCCPDYAASCGVGAEEPACRDPGAPCQADMECAIVTYACQGELMVSESMDLPGRCVDHVCDDQRSAAAAACAADGLTLYWFGSTCSSY
jgi:hypothetical protein